MNQPAISVVITTHNRAEILPRAIESVVAQTYDDYDVHIVDDCSSDNTPDVVKSIIAGKENYYYWRPEDKRGLASARNTGISRSSGRYIAFLDDDDEWKSQSLAKRMELVESLSEDELERLGVVYCGHEINKVSENRIEYNMPKIEGNIKEQICAGDLWTIPSSCLFPRTVLEAIGGYDETLFSSVDHDIWMNLAAHGYCARHTNDALVVTYHLRQHKSMVVDTDNRIVGVEQYLSKWEPTFAKWFGVAGAANYIRRYRRRILGRLLAVKCCQRDISPAGKIVRHLISKSNCSIVDFLILSRMITIAVLGAFLPGKIVEFIRSRRY
jgi:glycosyltransferase involved in cell wall biosynthesis